MFSKLRSDIACILERDPAARSTWEVLTCYPGLHAIWIHKLAHWFWNHRLPWLGRLPGDFVVRRGPVTFYFPLATSLVVSVVLSLLAAWFWRR